MKIADKLKKIREEKGYSQEALAHNIGVSYVTYHNMEHGKIDIRFSVLEKCAEALEVPLLELLPEHYTDETGSQFHESPPNK